MYVEKCCISPGNHTLTCYADKQPDGWKQGYIEILDRRYCDNFIGFKTMNRVEIKSNKSNIIYYNIEYSRDRNFEFISNIFYVQSMKYADR